MSELRYLPFGETRWAWGVTPTDRRYTGQRELAGVGLYDYNARMYWPAAGRFVSADTVVPDPSKSQQFNRYLYVGGNPVRFTDPSGHCGPVCIVVGLLAVALMLTSDVRQPPERVDPATELAGQLGVSLLTGGMSRVVPNGLARR